MRALTVLLAVVAIGLRTAPFAFVLRQDAGSSVSLAWMGALWLFAVITPFALLQACGARDATERVLALAVFAFDPLSIAAVYGASAFPWTSSAIAPGPDALIGSTLCCAGAGVVWTLFATSKTQRRAGGALALIAGVCATWFALRYPPTHDDALFLAWTEFGPPALARVYAVLHHVGYAIVPLALLQCATPARRPLLLALAFALVAVALADRWTFARFASLAAFAPVLTSAAVRTVIELRRTATDAQRGALRAFGLVLVVLAVDAPVLVSDALSHGPRLPRPSAPSGGVAPPTYTTAPEAFTSAAAKSQPQELPRGAALDAVLARPFRVLLPVVNGHPWRGDREQMRAVERITVPAAETRATRFDLYRFEVREYVRAGAP
jgi:hypothetical protein